MIYDVITIGSAMRDIFLFLEPGEAIVVPNPTHDPGRAELLGLEYGAKIPLHHSVLTTGGGALNSAITFNRLGFKVAPVVALGCDDMAESIVMNLKRAKIPLSLVSYHSQRQTGFSVLLVDAREGEHVALVHSGANDAVKFSAKANSSRWYYTTAVHGPSGEKALNTLLEIIKKKQVRWAWNPGGEQIRAGIGAWGRFLKHCTVLILNRDEAVGFLQDELGESKTNDIKYMLAVLLQWGPKMVIITDGYEGAYYADAERALFIATDPKAVVVESTGAGDAFGSGFVAGLLQTKEQNAEYALQLAMANAQSVIGHIGAQDGILRSADLKKVLNKKYKIKKI